MGRSTGLSVEVVLNWIKSWLRGSHTKHIEDRANSKLAKEDTPDEGIDHTLEIWEKSLFYLIKHRQIDFDVIYLSFLKRIIWGLCVGACPNGECR